MKFQPLSDANFLEFIREIDIAIKNVEAIASRQNPDETVDFLTYLTSLQVSSTDLMATAKYHYGAAQTKESKNDWNTWALKADRQNAALGKAIIAIQSVLKSIQLNYSLGNRQT